MFMHIFVVTGAQSDAPPTYEASNMAYSRSNSESHIPPSYARQPRLNEISMSTTSLPAAKASISYQPSRHFSDSHLPHAQPSTSLSGAGAMMSESSSDVDLENEKNLSREKGSKSFAFENSAYS